MVAERSDAELLAASVADPAAFGLVVERYERAIFGYLRARVGDEAAVDLAARTFADAFAVRARYRPERATALPWLFGIAANHIRRHRRTEGRRRRFEGSLPPPAVSGDHAEGAAARADADAAWTVVGPALASLPVAVQETLLLHLWQGLTYEKVASALGVPIGTVRSRINRAKRSLRDALAAAGFETEEPA